jgi:predicted TIM-barrel fold metal-dependent hydrolase
MTISRRNLLKLPALTVGVSVAAQPARRFIIDGHQHFQSAPDYISKLIRTYQPRNAMACVLTFMPDWPVVKRAAREHPEVIIPYGRIVVDAPDALSQIDKFAAEGAKGVKMHKPRDNWDDARYFPLYERLEHHKLVALFHTGIAMHEDTPEFTGMARMRPEFLDTIARAFPNLYIHGAHLGNPWYDEAAEVARWSPRVYFDLTGSSLIKKAKNLSVFRDYLWWDGPGLHSSPHAVYAFEKLVFGTDEDPANLDTVLARYEALFEACRVPEASRRKVYGETLAGILGIRSSA